MLFRLKVVADALKFTLTLSSADTKLPTTAFVVLLMNSLTTRIKIGQRDHLWVLTNGTVLTTQSLDINVQTSKEWIKIVVLLLVKQGKSNANKKHLNWKLTLGMYTANNRRLTSQILSLLMVYVIGKCTWLGLKNLKSKTI